MKLVGLVLLLAALVNLGSSARLGQPRTLSESVRCKMMIIITIAILCVCVCECPGWGLRPRRSHSFQRLIVVRCYNPGTEGCFQ